MLKPSPRGRSVDSLHRPIEKRELPPSVLLLDKPTGPTSHDGVDAVRRALRVRRVGHFGTLDPFASGLLVLGIGSATRLAFLVSRHEKEYRVGVRLGWRSATDDSEGHLTPLGDASPPSRKEVERACRAWVGEVRQVPPAYSAKHVGGRRAYDVARAGEAVELPDARVTIHAIEIERYHYPDIELRVTCGAGTYMRSLARDLGEALGTGGYCARLRRVRSGPFSVDEALPWTGLADPDTAEAALLPAEAAVGDLPSIDLDLEKQRALAQGRTLSLGRDVACAAGWVRLRGPAGFIGIGELGRDSVGAQLRPRRILIDAGVTSPDRMDPAAGPVNEELR